MNFAYSRVSTKKQVLDRQIESLSQYVDIENIEQETCSGTVRDRKKLTALLGKLREGDKLYVHELSRLARSTSHLLEIITQLNSMGVELISITERIETQSANGRLMVTMLAAICEFEAALTRERVLEGLAVAKANGKKLGRKPTDPKKLDNAVKLYLSRVYSVRGVAQLAGVSVASLYRELDKRGIQRGGDSDLAVGTE